jgi:hypothetical protein
VTSDEPLHETIQRLDTAIRDLSHSVSALTESTKIQIEIMRADYQLVRADLHKIDKEIRTKASQDSVEMLCTELNKKLDVILNAVAPFHHDPLQHVRFKE